MTTVGRHAGASDFGRFCRMVLLGLTGFCASAAEPATAPEHLELAPITGPEPIAEPPSLGTPVRLGTLVAVIAAAIFVVWLGFRPKRPPPPLPPHQWAFRELDRLAGAASLPAFDAAAVSAGVVDLVRQFLERRFGIPASEQTTPELLAAIERSSEITADLRHLLERFFRQADLVKFTGMPCTVETAAEFLETARTCIRSAAARLETPVTAELARETQADHGGR